MSDEKWTEFEIKLAFQDKTAKDLSAALYDQQKRIDALEKTVKDLKAHLKSFLRPGPEQDVQDEKPPHY